MRLCQVKEGPLARKIRRSTFYHRFRHLVLPPKEPFVVDDRDQITADAPPVLIEWPPSTCKPTVGVIQDYGDAPRWTKYCRFLEANAIPHHIYDIHARDWCSAAAAFDVIVGVDSCELFSLDEIRRKYYVLERHLHKKCYPRYEHVLLYEDKLLEAYLSQVYGLAFVRTYIYTCRREALAAAAELTYPLVSKRVPGAGSLGVELVRNYSQCRSIIQEAFSPCGRRTHWPYATQKGYVYFQDYVPNDGYDLRVIVVGTRMFGYYRKVPKGEFRASGMGLVEKRALPAEALRIAERVYGVLQSPMLVVDMLKDLEGQYHIIEISPFCKIETPEQLHVRGIPGYYVARGGSYVFEEGRFWVHELALKEFFGREYGAR